MRVSDLLEPLKCSVAACPEGLENEVRGGYCCDLLSWVVGRADLGAAWITVMTNVNVVAVAIMAEVSCVVITENSKPDEDMLQKARAQGVTLLTTPLSSFAAAAALGKLL